MYHVRWRSWNRSLKPGASLILFQSPPLSKILVIYLARLEIESDGTLFVLGQNLSPCSAQLDEIVFKPFVCD